MEKAKKITAFLSSHKTAFGIGVAVLVVFLLTVLPRIKSRITHPLEKYETARVKIETISQTVSASGGIQAERQVTLAFQTSGQLAWVGVKEGDRVRKWQAIASLDKRELEKNLKKKLLAYMNQRWDFEQAQDDYDVRGRPLDQVTLTDAERRILEKAQFDLDSSVLDVEIKDLAIKLATIISPIEGIVTRIQSPIAGVNITPTTAEFVIADPSQMKFVANVDEADIGQMLLGLKVKIYLDGYPDQDFEGEVRKIAFSSITTRGGGTAFPVEISLPENTRERFKVGMNGDCEIIITQRANALTIPLETVKSKEGKRYVRVVEGWRIKEVEVKTGMESEENVEIIEGLEEGQVVIVGEKRKKK